MGRPKNLFPTATHHKASGQARVRIGGKDIYLGRWGSAEAREAYSRLIGEAEVAGTTQAARRASSTCGLASTTVSDICLLWLDHAELTYVKNGKQTSHVGTFKTPIRTLREIYGETPAAKFGPLALEVVRARFVTAGLSRRVANRYVGGIRKIFRWAASRELIPATVVAALATLEPLQAGRTTAPENDPVEPIDDDTVAATLPHLTPVVADMVRLARATGCRPGEVCSIRPRDVDRTGEVWKYRPANHKTQHKDRSRVVFIGPQGQSILAKYLLRPADQFCFSPQLSVQQKREAVAARRTTTRRQNRPVKRKPVRTAGDCYNANTFRVAIVRGCELAFKMPAELRYIPGKLTSEVRRERIKRATAWRQKHCWHPNQLRHTFATEARKVGGIESVQALLGHAELSTSQIYAERSTALATSTARQIG
jgi:integrase